MASIIDILIGQINSIAYNVVGMTQYQTPSQWSILVAGASAGLVVDSTLFPLDTIKSRLQSEAGFIKSGSFSNLYRGFKPVLAGSIPNAAIFFITYETIKDKLHHFDSFSPRGNAHMINHVMAASSAEIVSCIIRVPYEVIKTRSQTSLAVNFSSLTILKETLAKEGILGLYRGFKGTIIRDLPFSIIQYPLWEHLKIEHLRRNKSPATVVESAFYGSLAGGLAALMTTPLDVARTRIMLAERNDSLASGRVLWALGAIKSEKGLRGLFAGCIPRILWISAGAAIFLGTYEKAIRILS